MSVMDKALASTVKGPHRLVAALPFSENVTSCAT